MNVNMRTLVFLGCWNFHTYTVFGFFPIVGFSLAVGFSLVVEFCFVSVFGTGCVAQRLEGPTVKRFSSRGVGSNHTVSHSKGLTITRYSQYIVSVDSVVNVYQA